MIPGLMAGLERRWKMLLRCNSLLHPLEFSLRFDGQPQDSRILMSSIRGVETVSGGLQPSTFWDWQLKICPGNKLFASFFNATIFYEAEILIIKI